MVQAILVFTNSYIQQQIKEERRENEEMKEVSCDTMCCIHDDSSTEHIAILIAIDNKCVVFISF